MTTFQPVKLPAGVYKNGTMYSSKGRWTDSNLVRSTDGVVKPVGGWQRRSSSTTGADITALTATPATEIFRDAFTWPDNAGNIHFVFGSNLKLWHLSQLGVLTNITPAGVVTGGKDAATTAGYGKNPYGLGAYGKANNLIGVQPTPVFRWAFTTFGELLITCQRAAGNVYEVNPSTLAITTVTNAPTNCQDILLTGPRILMAIGAGNAARLVSWSTTENRNTWTPAVANEAGSITLPGAGRLLAAVNVADVALLVGEYDATVARYIGPPYVFSFDNVGVGCGTISAEAVISVSNRAFWWGDGRFFGFDGAIREIKCEVSDFLKADVDFIQQSKITAVSNSEFSEIWWMYQSVASSEVDSYVSFNYETGAWYTGRLNRPAGVDKILATSIVMVDDSGFIYNHEQAGVLPSSQPYITSGPLDVDAGSRNMALRYVMPDMTTYGDLTMTVYGAQSPIAAEATYGPFALTDPTPTTGVMGRQLRLRFDFLQTGAQLGELRVDLAQLTGVR